MKKLFEMPSIELTKFDVEDVITASTNLISEKDFADMMGEGSEVTTWNSDWNESLGLGI